MPRTSRLAAAVAVSALLGGCSGIAGNQATAYLAPVQGTFAETGTFTAELAFVADYAEGTFAGELRDVRTSRPGLERPAGVVPFAGTLARNEEGEFEMAAEGAGTLSQEGQTFAVELEVESYYVEPDRGTITVGMFGGGELERGDSFVAWLPMAAEVRAEAVCRPGLFASGPCTLPPPVLAAAAP
jgi:hypothetical protein